MFKLQKKHLIKQIIMSYNCIKGSLVCSVILMKLSNWFVKHKTKTLSEELIRLSNNNRLFFYLIVIVFLNLVA